MVLDLLSRGRAGNCGIRLVGFSVNPLDDSRFEAEQIKHPLQRSGYCIECGVSQYQCKVAPGSAQVDDFRTPNAVCRKEGLIFKIATASSMDERNTCF